MEKIYRKNGRRYKEVLYHDWRGFPRDGIFLVTTPKSKNYKNVSGYSCILRIGELPDLYPFAQMAISRDELANFIGNWKEEQKKNNPRYNTKGKLVGWTEKSNCDFANDILKFLASLKKDK